MNPYRIVSIALKSTPLWMLTAALWIAAGWLAVAVAYGVVAFIMVAVILLSWLDDSACEWDQRKRQIKNPKGLV